MPHQKYVIVDPKHFNELSDLYQGKSFNSLDKALLSIIKNKNINDHSKVLLYNKILNSVRAVKPPQVNEVSNVSKDTPKKSTMEKATNTRFLLNKSKTTATDYTQPTYTTQGTSTEPYEKIYEYDPALSASPSSDKKSELVSEVDPDLDDFIFHLAQQESGQTDGKKLIKRNKSSDLFETFDDVSSNAVVSVDKVLAKKKFKELQKEKSKKLNKNKSIKWVNF